MPLLVFIALQLAAQLSQQSRDLAEESVSRALLVMTQVDAAMMADYGAIAALADAVGAEADLGTLKARIRSVQKNRTAWFNVLVSQAPSGRVVWDAREAEAGTVNPAVAEYLRRDPDRHFGGIRALPGCTCVSLHYPVRIEGATRYVVTVLRSPADVQRIVEGGTGPGRVTAVVDRDGLFVARSLDHARRIGRPATRYVQEAIRTGDTGLYEGVTWEGLRNRTAFATSPITGWSTHIALPAGPFAALDTGSVGITMLAGLLALAFAALLARLTVVDMREFRRRERQRHEAQRFEAVGRLAGEVAHDFNNLLTVIVGSLRRVQDALPEGPLTRYLGHALAAAHRGEALVTQLLSFARTRPLDIGAVDLAVTVGAVRGLLAQSLGSNIALKVRIDEDARLVSSNAAQLELALLNLASNSRDAMPDGGEFGIQVSRATEGPWVDLVVTDTGTGMPPDVASRAAEPYFTTKPAGKGTGIGLAQVRNLVTQSGGAFLLDSEEGRGTRVTLRLPAAAPAQATTVARAS